MLIILADVVDGVLVNVVSGIGKMVLGPHLSRRTARELDLAGWMDTEALTRDGIPGPKLELPGLSEADTAALTAAIQRDEVQGALQALLAARLTDAPETDATRAREAVRLALGEAPQAGQVSDYFDDKISALVADLEGRVGLAGLAQIRAEAYNSRVVALLGAIEGQVAALADPGRGGQAEEDWLARYRRQARARHGVLIPPDFDRRRRVPIADIYVPAAIKEAIDPERTRLTADPETPSLTVWDLAGLLGRTVLLGDPGGGKTTAANVLTHYFAGDAARKVPFLVTLREYAAQTPPEHSVAGHIEQNLGTLYQSPAPDGLVERLLLTGRAVVIFDGLDELLDTSRRRDVSERVEQFCSAYPITPVLVTSRVAGYDQARLDDTQFTSYRLGGFGDEEVAAYVRKWFASQEGATQAEADAEARAFLEQSEGAPDLRTNPLLLALMCILFRGAGALPRDQAGVYGRCAELLLGKWDEQRRIHRELRAAAYVERLIKYLAWQLFSSGDPQAAVTEDKLIAQAAGFLAGRAFETEDEARAAAREFVEFCRDRMWVFSDVGTTAEGEKLYAFTHRTFLEYFAAGQLAATSENPEELARILAPHLARAEWGVAGGLAIQIKAGTTDSGADRVYDVLLDYRTSRGEFSAPLMAFLISCVDLYRPSPAIVRKLTRTVVDYIFSSSSFLRRHITDLNMLFRHTTDYQRSVADELGGRIAALISPDAPAARAAGVEFLLHTVWFAKKTVFEPWSAELAGPYAAQIVAEAARDRAVRRAALSMGLLSLEQALAMSGGFDALIGEVAQTFDSELAAPYPVLAGWELANEAADNIEAEDSDVIGELAVIGRYIVDHPALPWARAPGQRRDYNLAPPPDLARLPLDEVTGLGLSAIFALAAALFAQGDFSSLDWLGQVPMPPRFRPLFRDWAAGQLQLIEWLEE